MHSLMWRLPLRIFNCQQFPLLLLNFIFRRQFGNFQYLNKLQGNGKTTNLQHHLLHKQTASSYSTIPTAVETLQYKDGKKIRLLNIECIEGKNDKKYIRFSRQAAFTKCTFPKIPLPEDGYSLVKAMDTLMSKFPDEEKPQIFHEFLKISRLNCEYKLEIRPNKYGQLQFSMELFKNTKNASLHQCLKFPVSSLTEFRDRMVKMLAKFDGTKQYGSFPLPLPKWITVEQEKAKQCADEEPLPRIYRRESLKYSVDPDKPADCWRINIEFIRGASGKKYIQISQKHDNDKPRLNAKSAEEKYIYIDFSKIPVPEDGYNLLSGMIDLANDFKKKDKLNRGTDQQSWSLICHQIVKGANYDYKLEILHSENDQQQLEFQMETITTEAIPSHKPKKLFVPIDVFDWLQAQMALTLAADLDLGDYENREEIEEDKSLLSNNKLPAGNGKTKNLQLQFLQKQKACSSDSTISTATENLEYTHGNCRKRLLNIECIDGENNEKYISLSVQVCCLFFHKFTLIDFFKFYVGFHKFYFPNIPLPEDAYSLIKTMDIMISKFLDEEKPPIFREFVKSSIPNNEYELVIFRYKDGQMEFRIEFIEKTENESSHRGQIFFPVLLLPKFRDRMVKMLAKFDGNQQCEPCPSPLSKWIKAAIERKAIVLKIEPRNIRQESMEYSIDPAKPVRINIAFRRGRGVKAKKYIRIYQKRDKSTEEDEVENNGNVVGKNFHCFPRIPVPEDGYNLLSGMKDLSNDFKQKGELSVKGDDQELIFRQIVKGVNYDYKLEIHTGKDEQLEFWMETLINSARPSHEPRRLFVPIDVFDWLQEQMALTLAADLDTDKEYEDEKENVEDESLPLLDN